MTSPCPPEGDVKFSVDSISITAGRGLGRSFQGSPPPCPGFLSAPGCLPAFSCSLSVGCSLTSVLLPGLGTSSRVTRWPAGVSCLRLSCRTRGWRVAGGGDRVKGRRQCRLGPTEPLLDWPEGGAQAQGTVCSAVPGFPTPRPGWGQDADGLRIVTVRPWPCPGFLPELLHLDCSSHSNQGGVTQPHFKDEGTEAQRDHEL